ncbi:2-heptaprenyl-1,4-naphthoquinone methyltransferase, putative [Paecilomyces variotii No. 5]|uniref:2-heptaprenyl-1,4-naphthoquinone methyltransferase, putative n=1 Tax=Byssochlamys spectabilis (strain No. 5 / NBRC 109023) TaxID=1356009 RepID=V5FWK9_BYSSN|nr:2-heptaprenyl-1,4-naphthoquinone methyltransferase, putative [Paecilomyces variotii No. 5]
MSATKSLSALAKVGFANASSYDKHRPSYPAEAVDKLLAALHLAGKAGAKVVDLAAGTGKFTEVLASRPEKFDILAVEPHDEMRAELERKTLPGVRVVNGTATSIPAASKSIDGLIAAQAWHWFSNRDSLEEIHRVLKPGGYFGVIWNAEDYNSPKDWTPRTRGEGELKDIIWRYDDNQPRFRHGVWRKVLEDKEQQPILFAQPLQEDLVPFTKTLSPSAVWDRFHTLSQIAILQGKELEDTKEEVAEILAGDGVERDENGEITLHGHTYFASARALPTESE